MVTALTMGRHHVEHHVMHAGLIEHGVDGAKAWKVATVHHGARVEAKGVVTRERGAASKARTCLEEGSG